MVLLTNRGNKMDWIDIKQQRPKHGQQVLITDGKATGASRADIVYAGEEEEDIWWDGCNILGMDWYWTLDDANITHWMPLPELPSV